MSGHPRRSGAAPGAAPAVEHLAMTHRIMQSMFENREETFDLTLIANSGGGESAEDCGTAKDSSGPNVFRAHRCVLAACSPYFSRMFFGGSESTSWKEAESGRVVLEEIRPETLRVLLHFVYLGELRFIGIDADEGKEAERDAEGVDGAGKESDEDEEEVEDADVFKGVQALYLADAARYFQMDALLSLALEIVESSIAVPTVLPLLEELSGRTRWRSTNEETEEVRDSVGDFDDLVERCLDFCDANASDVFESISVYHVSARLWELLLPRDTLVVEESEIMGAIRFWHEADPAGREKDTKRILEELVRLPLLPLGDVLGWIAESGLVSKSLIISAAQYAHRLNDLKGKLRVLPPPDLWTGVSSSIRRRVCDLWSWEDDGPGFDNLGADLVLLWPGGIANEHADHKREDAWTRLCYQTNEDYAAGPLIVTWELSFQVSSTGMWVGFGVSSNWEEYAKTADTYTLQNEAQEGKKPWQDFDSTEIVSSSHGGKPVTFARVILDCQKAELSFYLEGSEKQTLKKRTKSVKVFPCRFGAMLYGKGNGISITRRDIKLLEPDEPSAPCRYFSNGRCRFGDRCKFSHN